MTAPAEAHSAFRVERRGIEHVPRLARSATLGDLAGLWAGASLNLEYLVYGALAVTLGLDFFQAVVVVVVGNLAWVLTGLASLQGPAAGTTAFGVGRAVFGPRPNRVLAFFNWLTQVGFETEGLSLVVLAGLALVREAGGHPGVPVEVGLVLAAAGVQLALPLFGHATLSSVLKVLTWLFAASFVILGVLLAPKVRLHGAGHGATAPTVMVALAVIISGGGMSWTENANDYSRYLPRSTSKGGIVAAVVLGAGVPVVLTEVLGAAVATGVPHSATNLVTGLPGALPGWFLVPYLGVVIVQLFAINGLDLYSSAVSLQAVGLPLRRAQCVVVDTVVCTGLTAFAVLSNSFTTLLGDFLLFIMVWLAPWTAIYLVDWALRRGRYDLPSLFSPDGGRYRRRGGGNWAAVVAQVAGMVAALSGIVTGPFTGPLASLAHGADVSIFMGLAVGGVLYWLLAHALVRAEVDGLVRAEVDGMVRAEVEE